MGFKQAAVLSPISFFLGVLFICFNVDHRILYGELTADAINDGFTFYTTFFNAPPAIKALLHAMGGIGVIGLLSKLLKWDESALFFDGSSMAAYIFGIAVYVAVTIPALRTIVTPIKDVDTREDQIEALRILAAGNTIIVVILGAILVLQAGQEYTKRLEAKELAKFQAREKAASADKKDK